MSRFTRLPHVSIYLAADSNHPSSFPFEQSLNMRGLIAIEEAFQIPGLAEEARNHAPPGETSERLAKNLVDIDEQRPEYMDEDNVHMEVSGISGIKAKFTRYCH